ncbi:MAG: hypothetical protein ACE5IR_23615 [bacterium]
MKQFKTVFLLLVPVLLTSCSGGQSLRCETFDTLALGDRITVFTQGGPPGNTFQPPNGDFVGRVFYDADGNPTSDGFAEIENATRAGGTGHDVEVNNINFSFSANFGQTLNKVKFSFGEYGGNLNLSINGQMVNFDNFVDIDGQVIGGVKVTVLSGGLGNDSGEIELNGTIRDETNSGHITVGGQELWIDNFCWEPAH